MSIFNWIIGVGIALIVWQLVRIGGKLYGMNALLSSLDSELFHLAQEQNPTYGVCSNCGCRSTVSHVVLKNSMTAQTEETEMFYCQSCWWMSDSVQVGDKNNHYKDRLSNRDRMAMRSGPG